MNHSQLRPLFQGVTTVLSESVLDQNGQNDRFGQNDLFQTGFGIRETKMDQNGPFWPKEVYFGPFRSADRTLATPDI